METPRDRKRRQADDAPRKIRRAKRAIKAHREREFFNFPPGFYDDLSKVWLTKLALREIDRPNEERSSVDKPKSPVGLAPTDVARFARHGGPDLRHLRGVSLAFFPAHARSFRLTI